MGDFLDEEAMESEGEDISDEDEKAKAKRKAKMLSSDEEEEEDDEEKLREEMKGFIADEDEESGSGGSGDSGSESDRKSKKRRRRKRRHRSGSDRESEEVDEEDMELLQENLGFKIKKQRRRIRMNSDDEEDDEEQGNQEGTRELEELPDIDPDLVPQGDEDAEGGYESEDVNDFIVTEDGQPIKKERKKKHHLFSDSGRQLAEDIFGVAFDYEDFEGYGEDGDDQEDAEEDEEQEDYDEEDEELDEEERNERREKRKEKRHKKRPPKKTIFDLYEPKDLELRHFTDQDNEIRNTDMPERMQLRAIPVTSIPEGMEDELEKEAEWIYATAFTKPTLSRQEGSTREDCTEWLMKEGIVEKIRKALEFMRQQFMEVPVIANYRKEYVQPLKINDLWRVYYMDEKWSLLKKRKTNLRKLYANMLEYQGRTLLAEPEKPIPEGIKILTNEMLTKVDNISNFEELKDWHTYFKLYFDRDVEQMLEWLRNKRKEEREARKIIKKTNSVKKTKTITNEEGEEIEVTDDEAIPDEDPDDEEEEPNDLPEEERPETLKRAKHNDAYSLAIKLGLVDIPRHFGLSSEQFGENLKDGYQKIDVEQDPCEPLEVAAQYTNERLKNPEDVLKAATYVMATHIATEPLVRKEAREAFYDRSYLDVRPTKKGRQEIDENHSCYDMQYLSRKPIRELVGDQWLRLVEAEKDKLITINMTPDLPGLSKKTFQEEAQDLFKHDAFSKSVQEWNALRSECVEMAFKKMLFPMLRKELAAKLTREALDGVIRSCKHKLYDWIKVGKFTVNFEDEDEDEWDSSHGCRIMAIAYESDMNVASYAVMITTEGEVAQFVKLEHLMKRVKSWNERERFQKESDLETLRNFICNHRPHCVVIGAEDRSAIGIKMDVEGVVRDLVEGEAQFPGISVNLMDNTLAKVYANSERANQDFRDYPNIFRQALSLARRMQDPLVEFSQLTGPENEILCLHYHTFQDLLSEEELLEALTIELINRTNEVGVDINECVAHPFRSNLVQFVGGLGPRKGAALLKTLRQMQSGQRLENRQQLVTLCHMGPKVLINCAGFIKIDTSSLGDSEVYVEVLDGSRIHNEAYEWARKMAVDALDYDEDEGNPATALEEILQEPEKLAELDLDAFATELERQGFGKKHITLEDIRSELYHMYKDLREPFKEPNADQIFNMITKETPKTFYIGKLVQAVVTGFAYKKPQGEELDRAAPRRKGDANLWQCPFCGQDNFPELTEVWNHFDAGSCPGKAVGVKIRLDNGISGFIPIKNLSDSTVIKPDDRVKVGQNIVCRITKIQPERFSVEAICKSSALVDKDGEWKPPKDDYYDYDAERRDKAEEENKKKAKERQSYTKRVIVHPHFHNIGYKEAEGLMKVMEQGDVVIRPSSKGEDRLTVTWKVTDGIYQHIDVKEEGKVQPFSLGQSLWIGNGEFEDLDEIIARHIAPMAAHARDLINFKYCRNTQGGNREVAEEMLKNDKRAAPLKIHYFFSPCKEFPGKFMLSYLPRNKAIHEYVTITPDGFRLRRQHFDSLPALVKWFKEHFRDPIPGTPKTPGGGRLTNRTPYLTGGTPSGGITPGAMSMTAGTPYGQTPMGYATNINTPYTPSGQTPILTPYNTPGPSMTPKAQSVGYGGSGSSTPRGTAGHRGTTPYNSGQTPRGAFGQIQTPIMTPYNTPGPSSSGGTGMPRSAGGHHQPIGRSPAASGSGHTPRGNFNSGPRRDPSGSASSRDRSGRRHNNSKTANGVFGANTGSKRTPRGYSDATPLYDE